VEAVTDSGEVTTVYNVRIAEYHTYFVGSRDWAFSVWAHNVCNPWQQRWMERLARTAKLPQWLRKLGPVWHHLYPVELAKWFAKRGVDIEKYLMPLPKALHDQIHQGPQGGLWNWCWREFQRLNPDASPAAIEAFAKQLIDLFGLGKYAKYM
jgi:hypothetical protein